MEQVQWLSPVPGFCETCGDLIKDTFYDAKTALGPCACMCPTCFTLGPGIGKLGTGFGQKYERQGSKWVKTAG